MTLNPMIRTTATTRDLPALILAGGQGTRLRGVLDDLPKPLAPVGGRPFVTRLFDQLAEAGIGRAVLCTGFMAGRFEREFETGIEGMDLGFSVETTPLGTGGALAQAVRRTDAELILVLNGDSYVDVELGSFIDWHERRSFAASMVLAWQESPGRYGSVDLGPDAWITGFREKSPEAPPGWINAGVYLVSRQLLDGIPTERAVSLERDVFPAWVAAGCGGYAVRTSFLDIGTPDSLSRAEAFFAGLERSR